MRELNLKASLLKDENGKTAPVFVYISLFSSADSMASAKGLKFLSSVSINDHKY